MEVKKIMTKRVTCLKPNDSLFDCMRLFSKKRISGAPVIDRYGRVLGAVSESDITKAFDIMTPNIRLSNSKIITMLFASLKSKKEEVQLSEELEQARQIKVKEFMSKPAILINSNASVFAAIKVMTENDITRIAVVDDNKKLKGIVARADVINALASSEI